ncbi:MAG: urea ABC transporter permease subunit UrtB [Desulfobulbaceae bacterium]|jgi:urea transport system permease protein|nr:urea ABC transporter permease subunit UrtB [Desulfobulbaceae bacterium]
MRWIVAPKNARRAAVSALISILISALVVLVVLIHPSLAIQQSDILGLAADDSSEKIVAIGKLAETEPRLALRILPAMLAGELYRHENSLILIENGQARDAVSGQTTPLDISLLENVMVNNRLRKILASTIDGMRLLAEDRGERLKAAQNLAQSATAADLPFIDQAMARETDPAIRRQLQTAWGKAAIGSPDAATRLKAIAALRDEADPSSRQLLAALMEKDGATWRETDESARQAAREALSHVEGRLALGDNLARIFSGLSLASILLLAALGLAITYGVMGVINMAHGELLMIGAYAAFATQSFFRAYVPAYIDWYPLAALPAAFIAAAVVGMMLERLVIRHLYGRPLETLLATWGLSLILIQLARVIFGPQNVEVANPTWMSGGLTVLPNLLLPWNRLIIIVFALAVLFAMWAVLNLTRLGLFVRAVTQNRAMSACVGVATGKIDMLAFGLGSGVAGLGGVALSQITNVGPDMGQNYIVDSFMVVVLGGVGQLAGAVWAALGLGVATKFLEGWAGAVVAKIAILAIIIIVIQKRPQGLFALKGRATEN